MCFLRTELILLVEENLVEVLLEHFMKVVGLLLEILLQEFKKVLLLKGTKGPDFGGT